ncbi:serine-rich coiled-coil domain-containing protein 2 isoform X2 [Euwallacea fornicatus]|uniref:serine-rich coiled-coil domain-containing protein 2 isoform X2 n=1 Tax=Euwallacea fornicatus TaxID=995702 RepID=UPI00338D420F
MGQCSSGNGKPSKLSIKGVLSHNKKTKKAKMDKHKYPKDAKTEDHKIYPSSEANHKKPNQKCTKGVAMSFGFKRRPTPMTVNNPALAWETTTKDYAPDANGNKAMGRNTSMNTTASSFPKPQSAPPFNKSVNRAQQNRSGNGASRLSSPSPDVEQALCSTFTRNVTLVTRTQFIEKTEVARTDDACKEKTGKFTLQTTRLPQPEPIRVIETKTAKTIANNNRRSARLWRRQEENSVKITTLQSPDEAAWQERVSMDNCESFNEGYTPPPLPSLPALFNMDTKTKDNKNIALKSGPPGNFLKSRGIHSILDRDSPQGSCDQDWINAGEAMADDISLNLSPKRQLCNKEWEQKKPLMSNSLDMIDSLKDSMHLTLSEEDPKFAAVATSSNGAGLLDDEILSPVESLLSSSETEELDKKKPENSSSNSKDVNEKLTPSSCPASPVNVSFSLSLSDDKEDFLIDDEIADQPELVFERQVPHSFVSPLLPRRHKEMKNQNRSSLDSLSACDSIGSEDLMLDFDLSQTNDIIDAWDKDRKLSFTDSRRSFFKSVTPRNSLSNLSSPSRVRTVSKSPKKRKHSISNHADLSECLTLTKANHSAVQQDIIAIKTMLLTLKRVLNDSDTDNCYSEASLSENNNSSEFKLELTDLKRQVLYLQGQLEDKENTVSNLQKQIDDLATKTSPSCLFLQDTQNTCNAATQTERARPSSGLFSLTTSPVDETNSIVSSKVALADVTFGVIILCSVNLLCLIHLLFSCTDCHLNNN